MACELIKHEDELLISRYAAEFFTRFSDNVFVLISHIYCNVV